MGKKTVAEEITFVQKMVCGIFGKTIGIEDVFPIIDIGRKKSKYFKKPLSLVTFDKERKDFFLFKRTESFDRFIDSDNEIRRHAMELAVLLNNMKDKSRLQLTYIIDDKDKCFEEKMKTENEPVKFFNEWKKHKYEQFKRKKKMKVYAGVKASDLNLGTAEVLKHLRFEPMNVKESFNFLFDWFNLDKRSGCPQREIPRSILSELGDPSVSLLRILYKSYLIDNGEHLRIGDYYAKVMRLTMPSYVLNINNLLKDLMRLDTNVIVSVFLKKDDNLKKQLQNKANFAESAIMSINSVNKRIAENIKTMLDLAEKHHLTFFNSEVVIITYDKNKEKLLSQEIDFQNFKGAYVTTENYNAIEYYFDAIPGMKSYAPEGMVLTSFHEGELVLGGSYENDNDNMFIFEDILNQEPENPEKGVLNRYNFYDPRKEVNSTLISAPTGRGKSVLLNYIVNGLYRFHGNDFNFFIADYGGSYINFVNRINQDLPEEEKIVYKKLSLETKEYMNILDLEYGKEITEGMIKKKIPLVKAFLTAAFKDELSNDEEILIDIALQELYNQFLFGKSKRANIDGGIENKYYYIDKYTESKFKDKESFLKAMPTIADLPMIIGSSTHIQNSFPEETRRALINKISNFIKQNETAVFCKNSTDVITNKRVIVDFKEVLKTNKYLANLYLLYYTNNRYLRFIEEDLKGKPKIILIDEYPQFLSSNPQIEKYVDTLFKTGRKEKIDTYLVSQNINTYNKDFFENVGSVIILRPKTKSEIENIKEAIGVDDDFIEPAMRIKTVKGEYSEIFVISLLGDRIEKTALRLRLNEFEKKYFTLG